MATLYDLAMQYLNQSLPKTFKYDRTNQPGTNPPGLFPQPPVKPIAKILPVQGGGDNNNLAGSISPMDLSTDFSQITLDRQKRLSQDPTGLNKFLIDNLGMKRPQTAEDIVNLGYRTPSKFGITALLPDKYGELPRADQAFIASRMGYTGPTVFGENNSGLSKDPFGLNTRSGFGNYAERVGVEAEKALDNLNRLGEKYNATWNDELGTFVGPGATKANQMTSMIQAKRNFYTGEDAAYKGYQDQVQNVLDADKEFSTEGDFSNYGIDGYPKYDIKDIQGEDDEEFDPLDPTNTFKNINPFEVNNIVDVQRTKDAIEEARLRDLDAMDPNPNVDNNNDNEGFTGDPTGNFANIDNSGKNYGPYSNNPGGNYNAGQAAENAQREAIQDAARTGMSINEAKASVGMPEHLGDTGGGDGQSNAGKIVCTMMNESYGFGSFRNKIWMKFHKDLSPEYQKGYHKLFLPLVRIAKTNKVVKKILEHIAVHSTIDMRQATRGKMHLLGRIYRKILLPLCYFVGKHG